MIVTPGTNLDMQALDESKNNYIMCIVYLADRYGVSIADVSTGDYYVTEVDSERKLFDEITKFSPSEIICNESFYMSGVDIEDLRHRLKITIYALETWYFGDELAETTLLTHFKVKSLEALELADYDCGMIAAGALLKYLYETQKNDLNNISVIHPYSTGKYMIIDSSTRRNLELVETLREKQKRGSLLWVLDKTKTAMGARLLRSYVEQPLIDKAEIEKRQDAICELNQHVITREELREYLNPIYDLERLISACYIPDRQSQGSHCLPQFDCHAAADQESFGRFSVRVAGRNPRGHGYVGGALRTDRPGYHGGTAHFGAGRRS